MGRAKCQICKAPLDTSTAYKVTDKKGKNKYYCNQTEFEAEETRKQKAKEDKDKVYRLVCDLFGYEIQNTQLYAEWQLWNKLKPNDVIYKYLRENEEYLQEICNRSFGNEYQRIRYFSAVLKNSLRDYQSKVEEKVEVKENNISFFEPINVQTKKQERRSFADLEEDDEI